MKIKVCFTLEIDPADYAAEYGYDDDTALATVKEEMRHHIRDHALASTTAWLEEVNIEHIVTKAGL